MSPGSYIRLLQPSLHLHNCMPDSAHYNPSSCCKPSAQVWVKQQWPCTHWAESIQLLFKSSKSISVFAGPVAQQVVSPQLEREPLQTALLQPELFIFTHTDLPGQVNSSAPIPERSAEGRHKLLNGDPDKTQPFGLYRTDTTVAHENLVERSAFQVTW